MPGVSCEKCNEADEIDGEEPRCISGECWIPQPDEQGRRVLELRSRLVSLADLNIGGEALRMYDADMEDIELLAAVEDELRQIEREKKGA